MLFARNMYVVEYYKKRDTRTLYEQNNDQIINTNTIHHIMYVIINICYCYVQNCWKLESIVKAALF